VSSQGSLEVTEVGSGDALVVFVHGVLGRGGAFDRVADVLAAECRMLWYDRRGYGASAGAPGAPAAIDTHIDDLLAVLDGHRAVLVGHSFGGVTAMGAAARQPELVSALVLYETSVAWVPGWDDGVMEAVFASDEPEAAALRVMLGDRYDAMGGDEQARRRVEARAFIAEERSVRTRTPPFAVDDIRAPVVYGRSDARVMPAVVEYLQDRIPCTELVTLPGAGHHAHRTDPAAFADLVRRGTALA
jgi:pimeloyl-ACP methyl ester carboxylesterase